MKKVVIVTMFAFLPCFIKPNPQLKIEKMALVQPIDNLVFESKRVKQSLDSLTIKLEDVE